VTDLDDIALAKLFSPLAGWAEHRLGTSQWRLAIEALNGHVVFYIAGVAFALSRQGIEDGIFATMLIALAWLLLMEAVRRIAYRQAGSSMGVQTARMREWHFRLILTVSLPVSVAAIEGLGNACYTISLILLLCHLCFKACDSPPPQRRRSLAFGRG
jgi:hypothetical protein